MAAPGGPGVAAAGFISSLLFFNFYECEVYLLLFSFVVYENQVINYLFHLYFFAAPLKSKNRFLMPVAECEFTVCNIFDLLLS